MRKTWTPVVLVGALIVLGAATAQACPMCANAVAEGRGDGGGDVPTAFYYSILFMLSMPFLLTASYGYAFYRVSKRGGVSEPIDDSVSG